MNGTLEMHFFKTVIPVPQTMANNMDLNHFFMMPPYGYYIYVSGCDIFVSIQLMSTTTTGMDYDE